MPAEAIPPKRKPTCAGPRSKSGKRQLRCDSRIVRRGTRPRKQGAAPVVCGHAFPAKARSRCRRCPHPPPAHSLLSVRPQRRAGRSAAQWSLRSPRAADGPNFGNAKMTADIAGSFDPMPSVGHDAGPLTDSCLRSDSPAENPGVMWQRAPGERGEAAYLSATNGCHNDHALRPLPKAPECTDERVFKGRRARSSLHSLVSLAARREHAYPQAPCGSLWRHLLAPSLMACDSVDARLGRSSRFCNVTCGVGFICA